MSAADEAYKAAEKEIARVKVTGRTELDFSDVKFRALEMLPPEIAFVSDLEWLDLTQTQISSLSPISDLTELRTLILDQSRISDLQPLSALTKLRILSLDNTQVSDLSPIRHLRSLVELNANETGVSDINYLRDLKELSVLSLDNTRVSDLSPIRGLQELSWLWLNQTNISDLRPLLELPALLKPVDYPLRELGLFYDGCPAFENNPALQEIYEIDEVQERTIKTLNYLATLPPWPEPLPWDIPKNIPDTPPDAPPDDPVPILIWTDDKRLDVAPSPPGKDELEDPIRQRLYDRLPSAVEKLWRAGNRYPEIDNPVRALRDMLESRYAEADILGIHLEISALTDVRDGNDDRPEAERIDPDCLSALANVLRIAPGVTIGHPDVDLLEERNREHARARLPETVDEGERLITQGLASDERLTTERTREYARRTGSAGDTGRVAEIRHGFTKKVVIAMATVAVEMGNAATGFVYGELTVNAAQFLILHKDAIMATAPSWGQTGYAWAEYVLIRANEIVKNARNP